MQRQFSNGPLRSGSQPPRGEGKRRNRAAEICNNHKAVFAIYDVSTDRPLRVLDQHMMQKIRNVIMDRAEGTGLMETDLTIDVQLTAPLLCVGPQTINPEATRRAIEEDVTIDGTRYRSRIFTAIPADAERRKRSLVFKLPRPELVSRAKLMGRLNSMVTDYTFTEDHFRQLGTSNVFMVNMGSMERGEGLLAKCRMPGPVGYWRLYIDGFAIPIEKARPRPPM